MVCDKVVCERECVTELCVKDSVCERDSEQTGPGPGPGYRIKNKNPRQRCGEFYIYIYPPTPAFAKAGAEPGTTGGVDPVFLEPLPRPTLQAKATTRPQQWLKSTPRPQQWLLL